MTLPFRGRCFAIMEYKNKYNVNIPADQVVPDGYISEYTDCHIDH